MPALFRRGLRFRDFRLLGRAAWLRIGCLGRSLRITGRAARLCRLLFVRSCGGLRRVVSLRDNNFPEGFGLRQFDDEFFYEFEQGQKYYDKLATGLRSLEDFAGSDFATLRLPWSDRLAREGGAMSGQAMMAAADTATVIAISSARGGFCPMTTVQLSTTFQRPVLGKDVLVTARLTKLGRTLAFADITLTSEGAVVAHATTVYALM